MVLILSLISSGVLDKNLTSLKPFSYLGINHPHSVFLTESLGGWCETPHLFTDTPGSIFVGGDWHLLGRKQRGLLLLLLAGQQCLVCVRPMEDLECERNSKNALRTNHQATMCPFRKLWGAGQSGPGGGSCSEQAWCKASQGCGHWSLLPEQRAPIVRCGAGRGRTAGIRPLARPPRGHSAALATEGGCPKALLYTQT